MALKLKKAAIDLGQTQIENIFINDYMPMATGTHVKVYLMAYYLAASSSADISNATLAKKLDLPLEDVLAAWKFWQEQGIVQLENVDGEEFDTVFLSIRELYLENNYVRKTLATAEVKTSVLIEQSLADKEMKALVKDIEETCIKRPLTSDEVKQISRYFSEYTMSADLIYRAFYITYISKEIKGNPLNYVNTIVNNWRDNNIYTIADLGEASDSYSGTNKSIKRLVKAIGLSGNIPEQVRQTIKKWLEQDEYSEEFLLYVINQTAKRTNNLNLNFLQYKLDEIRKTGLVSIEGAKTYFENGAKTAQARKNSNQKNKFRNFTQRTYADMSSEEYNKILERKRKARAAKRTNE